MSDTQTKPTPTSLKDLLVNKYNEATTQLKDIHDRAAAEDGREFTDTETKEATELSASIAALDKRITELTEHETAFAKKFTTTPPRRDETGTAGHPAVVTKEPTVYGAGSEHEFFKDLLAASGPAVGGYSDPAAIERLGRLRAENAVDHKHRYAVATGNLPGIVNPMFDPAMIARGIYDGCVTKDLLMNYPMTPKGESVSIPRVTTKATAAAQTSENTAFQEANVVTTNVKFDVYTVAARMEVSVQSIERGEMAQQLLEDELMMAYKQEANHLVLYGDGTNNEPYGLLNQTSNNPMVKVEHDDASPTGIKLRDKIVDVAGDIGEARHLHADAIIMGIGTRARMWKDKDTTGRPLFSPDERRGRNVLGIGRLVNPDTTVAMSVGDLDGIDLFTDPAIGRTFTDAGALTGGTQSRVLVINRSSFLYLDDGPSSYAYEQTLAAKGAVLLVVRGYAAFATGWYPTGGQFIYGTGTNLP